LRDRPRRLLLVSVGTTFRTDKLLQVHRVHDELLEVGAASSARVVVDAAPQAPPGRRDELRRGHGDDGFVFFLSLPLFLF
jgi:hypothetical protein